MNAKKYDDEILDFLERRKFYGKIVFAIGLRVWSAACVTPHGQHKGSACYTHVNFAGPGCLTV